MPSFSTTLEQAIHAALAFANARRHELATLEHLLLALIDEPDAARVMRACRKLSPPLWAMARSAGRRLASPARSLTCGWRISASRLPSLSQLAYTSHRPSPCDSIDLLQI